MSSFILALAYFSHVVGAQTQTCAGGPAGSATAKTTFAWTGASSCSAIPAPAPRGPTSGTLPCSGACQTIKISVTSSKVPGCTLQQTTSQCLVGQPDSLCTAGCAGTSPQTCVLAKQDAEKAPGLTVASCSCTCTGGAPALPSCTTGSANCVTQAVYSNSTCTGVVTFTQNFLANGKCTKIYDPTSGTTGQANLVGTCSAAKSISFTAGCATCSAGSCTGANVLSLQNVLTGSCKQLVNIGGPEPLYARLTAASCDGSATPSSSSGTTGGTTSTGACACAAGESPSLANGASVCCSAGLHVSGSDPDGVSCGGKPCFTSTSSAPGHLSGGDIAGIVIACLVFAAGIAALVIYTTGRNKQNERRKSDAAAYQMMEDANS